MSRPNQEPVAMILAGGQGDRLSVLSEKRAIPSIPFAGKYRIIDFTLSNCVNSGLKNLMVLTQYQPVSLHGHIRNGKPWDLDRLRGGVRLVSPYLGPKDAGWDRGTADAVYRNLDQLMELNTDTVLILAGDHIYKMDYRKLIEYHRDKKADVTLSVLRIPYEETSRFGVVTSDEMGRVTDFKEKPKQPIGNQVSMGVYVFNKEVLIERLTSDAKRPGSQRDFGRNILPNMIEDGDRVFAYPFEGYWRDIGTVQSYWEANMELLETKPALDLYQRDWVIYTRSEERPPAYIANQARIEHSLVSHGCQIEGQVIHSVLSPGVVVEEGAVVRDSVIMVDTVIRRNAVVDRAVIDKEVVVDRDCYIGFGTDNTHNKLEPQRLNTGITLVGKGSILPPTLKVGHNCKLGTSLRPEHFSSLDMPSGETLDAPVANGKK
jgi:glucose-1-phosphate adenylyltransferase